MEEQPQTTQSVLIEIHSQPDITTYLPNPSYPYPDSTFWVFLSSAVLAKVITDYLKPPNK